MKQNPNSRRGGENYKLFESAYNLHAQNNEHFKKLTTFMSEAFNDIGEYTPDGLEPTPSKKACRFCEFNQTEYCSKGVK